MTYSIIGILASIIMVIINRDVLWTQKDAQTQKRYRHFLAAVMAYYLTDAFWGILDSYRLTALQFADTTLYFAAMAAAVLLWTRYVISYLAGLNAHLSKPVEPEILFSTLEKLIH